MKRSAEALQQLKALRDGEGIRSMLAFLNGLTEHRFTAMYRFDGERLKNLYFFDRERPDVDAADEIPVASSYCVFVRNLGEGVAISDSTTDPRADGHPKQFEIRSYVGVPLIDMLGEMFGTVCHFDTLPRAISNEQVELMEALGSILDPNRLGFDAALRWR